MPGPTTTELIAGAQPAAKATTKRPAKKTAAARPSMEVELAPTDHDVPLLGGPGAGMQHFADVAPDQLASHPANPRRVVDGLEEMADSIRAEGILQRLVVAPTPADMTPHPGVPYLVLMGHRRLAAGVLAGLPLIPIEIRYDLDTTERQVAVMLVENIHRQDLTPVEEADAYQGLLDLGTLDETGLAHATGRSLTTIRQRLRLAKAPAAAKHAVQARTATLAEVELLYESDGDPAQADALAALADGDPDARRRLQVAANIAARRREARAVLDAAFEAGVKQVALPDGWVYYQAKQPMDLGLVVSGYAAGTHVRQQDIDAHADCPGHAVADLTADPVQPAVQWVCTEPSLHKGVRGAGGGLTDAEKAERAKTREQNRKHRELQDEVDVAAAVRRRHLRELVAGGGAPQAVEVLARLLAQTTLLDGWSAQHDELRARVRLYVDLLDVTLTDQAAKALDDKWMGPTTAAAEVRIVLDGLPDATAATAAAAAVLEVHLAGRWTPARPHDLTDLGISWLTVCRDHLGYELTKYEDTLLKKATAAAAKKAAKK